MKSIRGSEKTGTGRTYLTPFDRGVRYYLHRPNDYVDLYDEPSGRLWLGLPSPKL